LFDIEVSFSKDDIFVEPIMLSIRSFHNPFPQKLIQMYSWQLLTTQGDAKVIKLGNGDNFLRLEDFRSTNGINLYV